MKTYIRKISIQVFSALSILTALHTPAALAESIYDGIWQSYRSSTEPFGYFSITITNRQIVLISLDRVARYQDPLSGAYIGSLLETNNSSILPDTPFAARVITAFPPTTPGSWEIKFTSANLATIQQVGANINPLPPTTLQKIF